MGQSNSNVVPVLVLGGESNAMSILRSLSKKGIPVSISAKASCWAFRSRYCHNKYPYESGVSTEDFWTNLLINNPAPELKGSVLFPCSDDAIEFMCRHHAELKEIYLLDDFVPEMHTAMLDKQATLEMGKAAGCDIPEFWNIEKLEDTDAIPRDVVFPLMIKPIHSHLFQKHYPAKKYLVADDFDGLMAQITDAVSHGLEVMVCEMIPGADTQLCSYFTYIDKEGNHLFHYTKMCVRRYPVNSGSSTLQGTKWDPVVLENGRRFFDGIGFTGLGHIEFKRDPRDGKLKIIECNPRFSAAQEVVTASGIDMAYIMYCHVVGLPIPKVGKVKDNVLVWLPLLDFFAYREMKRSGDITTLGWLKTLRPPIVTNYFKLGDPWPGIVKLWTELSGFAKRRLGLSE